MLDQDVQRLMKSALLILNTHMEMPYIGQWDTNKVTQF